MEGLYPLSRNYGLGLNIIIAVIGLLFLIRAFILIEVHSLLDFVIIVGILVAEYFILMNYFVITFDQNFVYLRHWFSSKVKVSVPLDNVIEIKRTSASQGTSFYYLLKYYRNGVKKKAIFNLYFKHYDMLLKIIETKALQIEIKL